MQCMNRWTISYHFNNTFQTSLHIKYEIKLFDTVKLELGRILTGRTSSFLPETHCCGPEDAHMRF